MGEPSQVYCRPLLSSTLILSHLLSLPSSRLDSREHHTASNPSTLLHGGSAGLAGPEEQCQKWLGAGPHALRCIYSWVVVDQQHKIYFLQVPSLTPEIKLPSQALSKLCRKTSAGPPHAATAGCIECPWQLQPSWAHHSQHLLMCPDFLTSSLLPLALVFPRDPHRPRVSCHTSLISIFMSCSRYFMFWNYPHSRPRS